MATQSFIGRQADLFHKWLSVQTLERPVSELCAMLPLVNDYGKTHNVLQESIFELTESEQVLRLLSIIQADKRFIIVHRGHLKQIRLVIQKYCEFIEESKKNSASKMYSEQTEINQGFSVETAPGSRVLASKSQYAKKSSLCLKTKKGVEYYGETPAELLASLCDELAENHPAVMRKLIGVPYYGQGSVVLLPEEPDQGGIKLYNVNCYIDIRLGNDAVINYGKWICKQCSEPDMPERISSENNSVAETESSEVKPVSTIDNVNQLYSSKTPEKDEVSQEVSRATGEVSQELETDDSKETSKGKPVVIETATRAWSKYEVALLIETYLKTSENGYFRAAAEVLSHKLRDLAIKQGKAVDSTYRNVNGIMMQLGTVQYCFTNGKKGLSNASVQIREMVDMYKNHFTEYDKLLQDAHKTLGEEENEIAKFLQLEDYDVLRNELLKQGITSISQLKALDLWSFMNRYGLYSIRKRQEIFNNINELLKSSNDNGKDRKKYYIKTQRGLRYYGSTPADAFASYCEKLVQEYPLMIRKAIGLCYDATGRVVLWPGKLSSGSIKISNLNAYIDGDLSDQRVIQYGVWLCRRFGEKDEPVELCVSTEKQSASSLVKTQAVNHVPEEKKEINVQVTSEQSSKGNIEYKVEQQVELEGWDALVGDAWLFKMLSDKKIQYEDKRENQGCLWISGGHELDTFIDLCKGKGYRFHYKADGYKAFNKGPAWWTTDSVISDTLTEAQSSSLDASASKKKTNEIWSVEGDQLQFMNFHFIVPEEFDVLYKEKCSDSIVAFYPRRDKSFATLAISKLDQSIHDKNEVRKRFRDKVSYYLANEPNAKEEFSKTDETNTILAILSMISYTGSEGRNRIYKSYLYHKFKEDFCSLQIAVDGNDERAIDYDEVFKKLIESALKWKRVKQSADTPVSNDQKQIPVLDSLVSEKDADSQQSIEVVESEKQDTSDSTVVFRRWLEQSFRSYMVQFKGLSAKTVSQYCQSIEAVEQFIRKRNLPMTLVSVEAKAAQNVFDKLSLRSDFKDWNKKAHHQYSAALAQYIGFLTYCYSESFTASESKHNESVQGTLTLKDVVINVLTKANRPMTVGEIYAEIELKHLYTFNSSNPRMILDHAIRRSCEGVRLGDHTKEDVFGVITVGNGQAQYYLLEWGKPEQEPVLATPTEKESLSQIVDGKQSQVVEDQPSQLLEEQQPEEFDHDAVTSNPLPVLSYKHELAEQIVLGSDLEGISVEELATGLNTSVNGAKKIVNEDYVIVDICGKLIHKSAFVDWDLAADQLEKILAKLMEKNNGYVSKAQLYEYARADMQMFMNDNDMEDAQKIYDMAEHLFAKEKYHGVEYVFSNTQHIAKPQTGMSSVLDVIINYAREQGGFFNEDELNGYLESVKIKTGNLRNGIMHVYDKPTFLFYAYHVLVLSECLDIDEQWLSDVKAALDRLFEDMGDHVVLRDIQPFWYAQLPSLPGDRPWTGILLQSVLLHYGKKLGRAKTIYAYQGLSGDYLQSMLVSADSEVQSFNDAVIATLVENGIEQREFESEELRQILVDRGLIDETDLAGKLSKYIEHDERFVWSSNGQLVSIRI